MDNARPEKAEGNLLVVDDDMLICQTLEALLTRKGYEVRCARSGAMALMFAGEDPPELILLDIRLPDMNGFEVCRRLREDPRTGRIPVIFLSGLDEMVDKVKGFAAGGVDYITKPFQGEEVLARVRSHLDLKRAKESLQKAHDELEKRVKERTAELATANEQLVGSEKALAERLKFEALLAEISARFINLAPDQIEGEIEGGQRHICELFDLGRSALFQLPEGEPGVMVLTCLYQHKESPPVPERVNVTDLFPWTLQKVLSGETVTIGKVSDLPSEAARDRESYHLYGTKSTVVVPLSSGGGPIFGALSFAAMREERDWPERIVKGFQIIAQVFANALARKRADEEIRKHLQEIEQLRQRLEQENIYLQEEIRLLVEHAEIVGQSKAIKKILTQAEQVARTESTVLIQGETGTGKELLARAIHRMSARKDRPLITVNCASLPPTLIESELFGRERGAYTGALTRMVGRFEIADGSTLFLDEIGELPLDLQSKLLRVLEEGKFERLGSTKTLQVNVRVIAATNRDLAQEVKEGGFRKDLYYRLNVFPIAIPPLRERPEDIPLLVWAFVKEFQNRMGKEIESIPRKNLEALQAYPWPGNVRELRNMIERAMIVSSGKALLVQLPKLASSETEDAPSLEDAERRHIVTVLERTGWRVAGKGGAAEILGLNRSTLVSKMKKLGIRRPAF